MFFYFKQSKKYELWINLYHPRLGKAGRSLAYASDEESLLSCHSRPGAGIQTILLRAGFPIKFGITTNEN